MGQRRRETTREEEDEGEGGEFDDGTGSVVSCHPRRDSAPTITIICFPQFDDTGRICNDDECFLRSLLRRFSHSAPTIIG